MAHHPMRGREMSEPGWVYLLPACGPDRDLIKLGRSVNPQRRAAHFWGYIWTRPRAEYPSHFWAVAVENRQAAERAALQAMAPLRAFDERPAFWPVKPEPPPRQEPPTRRRASVEELIARVQALRDGTPDSPNVAMWRQEDLDFRAIELAYREKLVRSDFVYQEERRRWDHEYGHLEQAGLSEHFRCDVQLAVEVVSLALNAKLSPIPYEECGSR